MSVTDTDLAAAHKARQAAREALVTAIRAGEFPGAGLWLAHEKATLAYRDLCNEIMKGRRDA